MTMHSKARRIQRLEDAARQAEQSEAPDQRQHLAALEKRIAQLEARAVILARRLAIMEAEHDADT